MKQVTLNIAVDAEKLSAIRRYMAKKDLSLETEIEDAIAKLYEKYVPAPVREYIEESVSLAERPRPSRPRRAADCGSETHSEVKV